MIAGRPRKRLRAAIWSRRLAVFFLLLLLLTASLHRFASLSTPAAINLLAISGLGLLVAFVIAGITLIRIWRDDYAGTGEAVLAALVSLVGLAPFIFFGAMGVMLPRLNDISTTPLQPLPFKQQVRPAGTNPIHVPTQAEIAEQRAAYPDIHAITVDRSAIEAFALVREAFHNLGWDLVYSEQPGVDGKGYLQATARTLIMGYTDDVAVEVSGDDAQSNIDARSVSRYGSTDFGANADRIRALFTEIKADIDKGDRPVLEQAGPKNGVPLPTPKPRRHKKR
jgi:hypothetical protein